MHRYRFVVPDQQWTMCEKVGKRMLVDPKQIYSLAAGIGLAFLDMTMNPSAEMLRAVGEVPEVKGAVHQAVAAGVMPLDRALREAEARDKGKRRRRKSK